MGEPADSRRQADQWVQYTATAVRGENRHFHVPGPPRIPRSIPQDLRRKSTPFNPRPNERPMAFLHHRIIAAQNWDLDQDGSAHMPIAMCRSMGCCPVRGVRVNHGKPLRADERREGGHRGHRGYRRGREEHLAQFSECGHARGLAGKPLAGFCTTPSRRITVVYGVMVFVIRFGYPLLQCHILHNATFSLAS